MVSIFPYCFSAEECYNFCKENEYCTYFTFHEADGYCVLSNDCIDVSTESCPTCQLGSMEDCTDCVNPGKENILSQRMNQDSKPFAFQVFALVQSLTSQRRHLQINA